MTALEALTELIASEGPITVERYMAFCLGDPVHGYYCARDPFGAAGDFTTAPEISQIFGELLGLWAAEVWAAMGRPAPLRLVELGPGRGTLISDALRAARALPDFAAALSVHLVETSPVLRQRQQERLAGSPVPLAWHERIEEIPPGPAVVLANEFLDALPIRQFLATGRGWHERLVGLDGEGRLAFGLAPEPSRGLRVPARPGSVLEASPSAAKIVAALSQRLVREGGAAFLVDYGYEGPPFGDTLQAVSRHAYADPLANPGGADLTAHVDFAALARAARDRGARVHGPVPQGELLRALGIAVRAERLRARATPAQAEDIDRALERLTGDGPEAMGRLFKVMALAEPSLPALPGFEALTPIRAAELLGA